MALGQPGSLLRRHRDVGPSLGAVSPRRIGPERGLVHGEARRHLLLRERQF